MNMMNTATCYHCKRRITYDLWSRSWLHDHSKNHDCVPTTHAFPDWTQPEKDS